MESKNPFTSHLIHTQIIYFEGVKFLDGQFYATWDKIKGLKIAIQNPPINNPDEHYRRIEMIYQQLRKNFRKQNNLASAEAVIDELNQQKEVILGGFWYRLYRKIFSK